MAAAFLNTGGYALVFLLAILVPHVQANVAVFDNYWTQRQGDALKQTIASYDPNPLNVTDHLNYHVALAVDATESTNNTRRELIGRKTQEGSGKCIAHNPIDKCWRCDPNWEKNRKKLAECVLGFGRKTTGGKDGPIYIVNDSSDDDLVNPKPGTLRHAVTRDGPLWIIFANSMVIKLQQELMITSNKTIDGRGAKVYIMEGVGLTLQFVNNVIINNIYVKHIIPGNGGLIRDSEEHVGLRTKSDGDGISLFGATNVWIDHVSMTRCTDGMIDAIEGSTAVTISNSHFTDHQEVMLFGAKDEHVIDKNMQITVAFNHFGKRLEQRMPRCRFGTIHVVNNDYTHWEMYAIGGNMNPTIISQGNRFIAPPNEQAKEVTKREYTSYTDWKSWNWQSEGDYFLNGAYFVQSGRPNAWSPKPKNPVPSKFAIRPKPGTMVRELTMDAGALGCEPECIYNDQFQIIIIFIRIHYISSCPIASDPKPKTGIVVFYVGQIGRMSTPARKRLMRDFKRLQQDPPAGISGAPQDNNIMLWNAVIFGPDDTPWDGGTFKLSLQFSEDYPNKPPTVRFVSRMFHPNIYADGSICLDILQNQWSPIYDVAAILTSVQSLLCDPNPNSPANSEAARMYSESKREYNRRVRDVVEQSWTAD
ncbi:hypothetical protein IGI04_038634 [Brassica rapa subsp. trilocularis]|nr:hypothetical protein IGI04_038634 [Brassica rapa subsp. trilocularis]